MTISRESYEQGICTILAQKPKTYFDVMNRLESKHFSEERFKIIFEEIVNMIMEDKVDITENLDLIKMIERTGERGVEAHEVTDVLINNFVPLSMIDNHVDALVELYKKDLIKNAINNFQDMADDDKVKTKSFLDMFDKLFDELSDSTKGSDFDTVFNELLDTIEDNKKAIEAGGAVGIPLPWDKITEMTMGLQSGQTWVLGGPTSAGKSALAIQLMHNTIKKGIPVAFFSLEMTKTDVLSRLFALDLGVNSMDIKQGNYSKEQLEKFKETYQDKLFVFDIDTSDIQDIVLNIKSLSLTKDVGLFMIDYFQQVETRGNMSRHQELSYVAAQLQKVSQQIKKPIFSLSQLNNEALGVQGSENAGFKESGDIANKSNVAIKILPGIENRDHRTEILGEGGSVPMKLYLFKNRDGKAGMAYTTFSGKDGLFRQIDKEEYQTMVDRLKDDMDNAFRNTEDDDDFTF